MRLPRIPARRLLIGRGALTASLLGLLASGGAAQDVACVANFDVLVAKVQENYAGYPIEVVGRRDAEYAETVARARAGAEAAGIDEQCIYALREYTSWFDDPHLFIGQFPSYDSTRLASFADSVERIQIDPGTVTARLRDGRPGADPIEGLWYDGVAEIAVLPDTAAGADRFLAIVVSSASGAWAPGDVKARISRTGDRAYRVALRLDDHTPRYVEGGLYKDDLLFRIAPHAWGRRLPHEPRHAGLLHPTDPRAPTLSLRGTEAVVLSIPSHDPKYRPVLDSLVGAATPALAKARVLVVDLRGNEGGSSGTTRVLQPFYVSEVRSDASVLAEGGDGGGQPVVLASPANRRAFERWKQWYDPTPQWLTTLLEELETRTGELVTLRAPSDDAPFETPRAETNPPRFAVLVDRGVVSAGEAFLLEVRRYRRVTTYGEPTGGSIDYQNVQILGLADDERGFVVGYPTLATSAELPDGGWNATGIPPDVPIGPEVEDPIGHVIERETMATGAPRQDT